MRTRGKDEGLIQGIVLMREFFQAAVAFISSEWSEVLLPPA